MKLQSTCSVYTQLHYFHFSLIPLNQLNPHSK